VAICTVRRQLPWAKAALSKNRNVTIADEQNRINKKGGMPPFEPTVEQREIVYKASSFGLPQTDICCLIKNPRAGKSIDQETAQAFRARA